VTSPSILAITVPVGEHITTKLGPFTINLDDIISVCLAGLIVVALGLRLRRTATSGVPRGLQLVFETIISAVEDQVRTTMGDQGLYIVPLAVTLFVFILLCNWLELFPTAYGNHLQLLPAPTGDINLPAALAVLVIVLVHFTWIQKNGLRAYIAHYFKPPAMFVINVIEEIAKPLTLALRLFGNIFAGGLMLILIADLPLKPFGPLIPVGDVLWKIFDLGFVAPVQAFIFTLLTLLYFSAAVTGGH
jgi:F-type H+-transporting ATPase subunit a